MSLVTVLAVWILSSSLLAQPVSLGLRAGIPVTPVLAASGNRQAPAPRYTIGPLIEIHLWRNAAVGSDFLFGHSGLGGPAGSRRAEIWRWESPVTFVYRFGGRLRPIARTGISVNRVFAIDGATECGRGPSGEQFYCLEGNPLAELRHRITLGFVAGGGFGWKFTRVRLEPEVRLTHWIDRNFGVRDSAVRSNLNQVDFLVGVTF